MKNIFNVKIGNRHRLILAMILDKKMKFLAGMVCMLFYALSTSAMAFLLKDVLDDIFITQNSDKLLFLPAVVVTIFLVRGAAAYGQSYFMGFVGEHIIMNLRKLLYDRITDLSISFFQKEKTGVLMSRITNDVNIVKAMVSTAVTSIIKDSFTITALLFVVFYRDWKLACWAIGVLPLVFYPIVYFGRKVRRVSTGCQEAMAGLNSFLHETFAGNKIVKTFCMENYEKERFSIKNHALFKLQVKGIIAGSISSPIMELIGGLGIAFVIWFGGSRVLNGTTTAGTFISFLAAVLLLYDPIKKLAQLNNSVQEGIAAMNRVFEIVERKTEIGETTNPVELPAGIHSVSFQNVTFSYSSDSEKKVLDNINLTAKNGEIIALVGVSGGGKTSLVNLIPRFFDVTEGSVFIDHINVKDISLKSLRSQIGIVTQEPILFNESIKNNIRYGNREASEEEIVQAAKAAFAYDFIEKFPKKFDTEIGELGSRLSGGEKQRICIARALLKNASILILDEATSALDAEAERLVQKALGNLMEGRTTFVIAHRLSTIRHANRILVLSNGKIVEKGTHEDLLLRKGEYFKLYKMQFERKYISLPIYDE